MSGLLNNLKGSQVSDLSKNDSASSESSVTATPSNGTKQWVSESTSLNQKETDPNGRAHTSKGVGQTVSGKLVEANSDVKNSFCNEEFVSQSEHSLASQSSNLYYSSSSGNDLNQWNVIDSPIENEISSADQSFYDIRPSSSEVVCQENINKFENEAIEQGSFPSRAGNIFFPFSSPNYQYIFDSSDEQTFQIFGLNVNHNENLPENPVNTANTSSSNQILETVLSDQDCTTSSDVNEPFEIMSMEPFSNAFPNQFQTVCPSSIPPNETTVDLKQTLNSNPTTPANDTQFVTVLQSEIDTNPPNMSTKESDPTQEEKISQPTAVNDAQETVSNEPPKNVDNVQQEKSSDLILDNRPDSVKQVPSEANEVQNSKSVSSPDEDILLAEENIVATAEPKECDRKNVALSEEKTIQENPSGEPKPEVIAPANPENGNIKTLKEISAESIENQNQSNPAADCKIEGAKQDSSATKDTKEIPKPNNEEQNVPMDDETKTVDEITNNLINSLQDGNGESDQLKETLLKNKEMKDFIGKMIQLLQEKTTLCANLEKQNLALTHQAQSLKDVINITKDLLNIRNMEVEHLHTDLSSMEGMIKEERIRHNLSVQRLQEAMRLNDQLKNEYLLQLELFNKLKFKYSDRILDLTDSNRQLMEYLKSQNLNFVPLERVKSAEVAPVEANENK